MKKTNIFFTGHTVTTINDTHFLLTFFYGDDIIMNTEISIQEYKNFLDTNSNFAYLSDITKYLESKDIKLFHVTLNK